MTIETRNETISQIKKIICEKIDLQHDINDEQILEIITETIFEYSIDSYLSLTEKREITQAIFNSMRRLDILQPAIDDPDITEIMINGPDNIFFERKGNVTKSDLSFESGEKLEDVIQTVVADVNRIVNESCPIVDARLKDGSRVNIVLPPVALNGPVMTIRKFPDRPITMDLMENSGTITTEAAEILKSMVKAKYNIFISGGTGAGKTTFMNALSDFIPFDERIITIEDSAELQIKNIANLVRLETRNANTEGKGAITIRELIRTSLRMRPERIIVGEVRGPEALDMLQAMNTGHDGSISTGHANSTRDILKRLETMVLEAVNMPIEAIRQQIVSAIDVLIHLAKCRDKTRRVVEICEIAGIENGEIMLNPLFVFNEILERTSNCIINKEKFRMAGINIDFEEKIS